MLNLLFNNEQESSKTLYNKKYHRRLVCFVMLLVMFGIYMVISATLTTAGIKFIYKYFVYLVIGVGAFFTTAFLINYKHYQKYKLAIYLIVLVLLVAVIIFGKTINGAKRWLNLGIFSLQSSEFAKLAIVIITADIIQRKQDFLNSFKIYIAPMAFFAVYAAIIYLQRDLGTIALIASTMFAMFFVSGVKFSKLLSTFICLGIPFCAYAIKTNPYRIVRIYTYLSSLFDIYSAHENVTKALIAFGSGGIFGKGPGGSDMKMLHLPEFHTDFIFPIIGEECGFLGVTIIMVVYLCILYTGYSISMLCKNLFAKYLAFGITTIFTIQVIMNMGMTTGIFPPKGIPLPFISYGGSSMLISMIMMGILFNISRTESKHE